MTLIPESNNNLDANGDLPKLKRTFTLPRNPFNSTRMSKRRANNPNNNNNNNNSNNNNNKKDEINDNVVDKTNNSNNKRIFRRPSLKRFINKIAQHIGGVQVITNHQDANNHHHHNHRVPPPYSLQTWGPNDTPGVTGIKNHGNTCFINAVLQCISHTDILAEYFVLDRYKIDLLKRNKLNSKKFGTKGEVTEQLALLLKALWACQYNPEISTNFKQVIERHGAQYKGNQQHDALEFLQWLLDKVHEDLNTASKRKYKSIKTAGRPDEVVAAETLENYKRCNNSFIQGIFQAQYRSSLSCSRCRTQSNTFDPFQCISVQLPQFNKQSIYVTVLYTSQQPRQVQIGLSIPSGATISELRDILESDTSIKRTNMLITEIGDNCFLRTFTDQQSINIISEIDPIYCIEVPQLKDVEDDTTSAYILLCWINVLIDENGTSRRFGSPYTMQVSRETSYDDLQKLILKEMAPILHDDILTTSQSRGVFKIRISDPACNDNEPPCYLEPELEHPLFMEAIDQSLALCCDDGGPIHVKLILEFNNNDKLLIISDDQDIIEEHSSVKQLRQQSLNGGAPLTLEECLRDYTEAEILTDAWRCPHCQQYQPVVKTLDMWSLPEILVVHFKRFRQQTLRGCNSAKLTTMVDFPVNNLDMTPHLANKNDDQSILLQNTNNWSSPWKHHHHHHQQQRRKESNINNNIYDLYGVCYHHGSDIETGHYTAACKNPYDHQWYLYDDAKVTNLSKQTDDINNLLVNNSAYILFYQRRNGNFITNNNTNCCSSSGSSNSGGSSAASTSSVSSSNNEHWVCRMPKFIPPKNLKNTTTTEKTNPINNNSNNNIIINNNKDVETVKNDDNQQEQQQINDEVAFKNSQNTINCSNTNLKKSLENKSTNTINQFDDNNDNKQQEQQLYTTSIYINSCGEVNITTKQINDVDFIDIDDNNMNLTTMTEPERRKIYKTTAAVHRYSDNDRNIPRNDLNWMSPQPVRKLNHSQQSV